jgi:nucleotide-binding universal stress UspA family protein
MNRILVPVDFSPDTETYCRYALSLASVLNAEIILFHSFFDQIYFSDGGISSSFESGLMLTDEIILDFYLQKEAKLKALTESLKASGTNPESPVDISSYMESGDPELQILSAVRKYNPGLIVMGSTGMGKKRILSGSVARRIIDQTNVPVIAVPASQKPPDIRHVAYMTTFESTDGEIIEGIEKLFSGIEISYHIIHINNDKDDPGAGDKMTILSQKLKRIIPGREISFHILEDNDQYDNLIKFLDEKQIGLIAFIPHRRNWLRNLFYSGIKREDLFLTHIPLLAARTSG